TLTYKESYSRKYPAPFHLANPNIRRNRQVRHKTPYPFLPYLPCRTWRNIPRGNRNNSRRPTSKATQRDRPGGSCAPPSPLLLQCPLLHGPESCLASSPPACRAPNADRCRRWHSPSTAQWRRSAFRFSVQQPRLSGCRPPREIPTLSWSPPCWSQCLFFMCDDLTSEGAVSNLSATRY